MATTITKHENLVGKRIRRKEDPRLITGTATYVDDIQMPGMHHACILRSPHAAARIRGINAEARARSHPGVVAVFTGADISGVGPVPCGASLPGLRVPAPHHPRHGSRLLRRPSRRRRRRHATATSPPTPSI